MNIRPVQSSKDFPARDMHRRGYFSTAPANWAEARKRLGSLLPKFFRDAGVREASPAYCRSTAHYRQGKTLNDAALLAWQARVLIRSRDRSTSHYAPGSVDETFLERIADLSVFDEGPRLAREFVEKHGIAVVVEPHLPKTYLDGAAFLRDDGIPVVGLTLRHDKLDNLSADCSVSWTTTSCLPNRPASGADGCVSISKSSGACENGRQGEST